MDTNRLKKFAQQARTQLVEDVKNRLLYWGIDPQGNVVHQLEKTSGGYLFRGDVHNDASVPAKWESLVRAIERHSVEDIIEEASYTWFNRLIAMKILERNGYDQPALAYVSDQVHDPQILQNARKGILPTNNSFEINDIKRILVDASDDEQFSSLLIYHCRNHRLLNQIFGHLDDYTELLIPDHLLSRGGLLELINDPKMITDEDYAEVELIGWLYQFYISEKKDDVFASFKKKKKARAEDIPAATQIFTPKWIVKYLVENTVGRIWLDLHPESPIRGSMKYLVESENHTPDDPIIKDVIELKVLDPAVGSGHFLVVAFDLLVQMYKEEGYSTRQAVVAIIDNNLYGLDICPRAAGLANFAILLKAAKYHADVLREAHYPHVYAVPESIDITRNQVENFLGSGDADHVDEVHEAFKILKQGQNIGSALILNLSDEANDLLRNTLKTLDLDSLNLAEQMIIKRILPFAQVAVILSDHFPAIVANPPYMGSKNMNVELVDYLKANYPMSKSDLFAVFMELCIKRNSKSGMVGIINLPSWMFLNAYEKLRNWLIQNIRFSSLLHMGRGVFGSDFGSIAFCVKNTSNNSSTGVYRRLFKRHVKVDRIELKEKRFFDKSYGYYEISQRHFDTIPGTPIAYWVSKRIRNAFKSGINIEKLSPVRQGFQTGDNDNYLRLWHEVNFLNIGLNFNSTAELHRSSAKYAPYNKGGDYRKWFGNNDYVVKFDKANYDRLLLIGNHLPSRQLYFKYSLTWSSLSSGSFGARWNGTGFTFSAKGACAFPKDEKVGMLVLSLLNSKITSKILEFFSPTVDFNVGDIRRIPLVNGWDSNVDALQEISSLCIKIAQCDWDSRESSWNFTSNPIIQTRNQNTPTESSLQECIAIWAHEVTKNFHQLLEKEEELNRIFIDLYGLNEEINAEVDFQDITLLTEELDRPTLYRDIERYHSFNQTLPLKRQVILSQIISYSCGCFMGRYRLDSPGLNIAHSNPSPDQLSSYNQNGYEFEIDDDAIIPIMGSESPFSDDIVQRFQQFVLIVWGEEKYTENLNFINEVLDEDLEKFLTKKFWDFHKKMYKKRPIYWQFASPRGAFKVLTYMHRMNKFTVQKIRQDYLFKQMNYLENTISDLEKVSSNLSTTENRRLDKLRDDLKECRDYDLLLKDVADRQIEFDLDDGVVENYKLFKGVVSPI
jgi:type II restriction/modification system DNA methylase subunit YeeA